jgi:hypothetical protein
LTLFAREPRNDTSSAKIEQVPIRHQGSKRHDDQPQFEVSTFVSSEPVDSNIMRDPVDNAVCPAPGTIEYLMDASQFSP